MGKEACLKSVIGYNLTGQQGGSVMNAKAGGVLSRIDAWKGDEYIARECVRGGSGSTIGQLIGWEAQFGCGVSRAHFYCDFYRHCSTYSTVMTVHAGANGPRRHQFSV